MRKGEHTLAMAYGREALRIYQEVGDVDGVAWGYLIIGWSAMSEGMLTLAHSCFRNSVKFTPYGSTNNIPYALLGLAETLRQQGDLVKAGQLFGTLLRFQEHKDVMWSAIKDLPPMRAAHTYLTDPAFAAAWAAGEALLIESAIALALS